MASVRSDMALAPKLLRPLDHPEAAFVKYIIARSSGLLDSTKRPHPVHPLFKDRTGGRFGRLVAVHFCGQAGKNKAWLFRCDCGNEVVIPIVNVQSGNTQSCGCLHSKRASEANKKHGHRRDGGSPEYHSYHSMKSRCYKKGNIGYYLYGGRGITVCDRWLLGVNGKSGFECFLEDMGRRPGPGYSVDRANNELGYSPENCRWATASQQARNTSRNRYVEYGGAKMLLVDALSKSGVRGDVFHKRLNRGKTESEALAPVRKYRRKRP